MSEFPSCIRNDHTFNFSCRALILSAEDKRFSFLPCALEFVLFKWSKMSTKYANLDFQLSSQSKLQNSPCLQDEKKLTSPLSAHILVTMLFHVKASCVGV